MKEEKSARGKRKEALGSGTADKILGGPGFLHLLPISKARSDGHL